MGGIVAFLHVLRLVLALVTKIAAHTKIQQLLQKARAARQRIVGRAGLDDTGGNDNDQLRDDDGFRRD